MSLIDLGEAGRWVGALAGDPQASMHWQTYDDSGQDRPQLVRAIEGRLADVAPMLERLSAGGAGIFACVNEVAAGQSRRAEFVCRVRALFIDHDAKDGPLLRPPVAPSMVVRSGGGHHYYWILSADLGLGEFRAAQRRLIAWYGSDPKIHDLPRVLRVPGFPHRKGAEPLPVRIEHLGTPVTVAVALAGVPELAAAEVPARAGPAPTTDVARRVLRWLETRDPAVEGQHGDDWTFRTACHVLDFGVSEDEACDLMQDWNARCVPPWAAKDLAAKVRSAGKSRANSGAPKLAESLRKSLPPRAAAPPPPPAQPPQPPGEPPQEAAAAETPDERARSEILLAQLLLIEHGQDLRYCFDDGLWYVWDGRRFQSDERGEVKQRAVATVLARAQSLEDERRALLDRAEDLEAEVCTDAAAKAANAQEIKRLRREATQRRSEASAIQKDTVLDHMVAIAQTFPQLRAGKEAFDSHPWQLNVGNGILNLVTGQVTPHDRQWMHTRVTATAYEPCEPTPEILKVLGNLCDDDPATITWFQDALGASLLGNNRFEEFYILSGAAGAGKGTFFEALKSTLGDYCATSEFSTWLATNQPRIRDDLAGLQGARIILSSEVEKGSTLSSSVLKIASGNDTMRCRHLYGRYFEYRPTYTIWLQCNDRPRIDHGDEGMWRRVRNLHIGEHRSIKERDPDLKAYLLDPSRGGRALLAWLVAGCMRVAQAKEIVQPDPVRDAASYYRQEQDPLKDWILDCLRISATGDRNVRVPSEAIYASYEQWANAERLSPRLRTTPKKIAERLTRMGLVGNQILRLPSGRQVRWWVGVTLSPETYSPNDDVATTLRDIPCPSQSEHEQSCARHGLARQCYAGNAGTPISESPHARARAQAHMGIPGTDRTSVTSVTTTYKIRENIKEPLQDEDPPTDDWEAPW